MMPIRLLALVLAASLVEADPARSVEVSAVARDGRVYVSSTASDGVLEDVDEAIQAGLTASITFDAELRRPVNIWFDRTIATAIVSASVQYDTLTRRYQLSRSVDGRLDDSRVTEDKGDVKRFALRFDRLPLFGTGDLEPNAEYYVRVRAQTRPRNSLFVLPWERGGVLGSAKFTFLPR